MVSLIYVAGRYLFRDICLVNTIALLLMTAYKFVSALPSITAVWVVTALLFSMSAVALQLSVSLQLVWVTVNMAARHC